MKRNKKTNDLFAVDLSGGHLRLVRGQMTNGGCTVEDAVFKKLTHVSDADLLKEVLEYFKAAHVFPREVLCVVPSKLFISKNVEIPSTEKEEIAKIIDLQAGRFTPYSRDEIVIDFLCMETPNQHYTSVLLIIVNRALVDRYCRIFEDLGISVKIGIAAESMARVYRNWLVPSDQLPKGTVLGGICIAEDASDLIITDRNQIIFVRSISVGFEHFQAGKEPAAAEFIRELNQSLAAYHEQGVGSPIISLALTGLWEESEWLSREILQGCPLLQKFGTQIQPKKFEDQFEVAASFSAKESSAKPAAFFDLAAAIEKSKEIQIDLIPKEIKLKRRFRDESREITTLGIMLMTIMFVLSFFLYTKIYFKNVRMQKMTEAGKESFEEARMLERVSTKNRVVRKIIKNRGKGLSAFNQATEFLGESTYLSHLDYDLEGYLNLGGTTESMSQVFALVNRLEASNYYVNVKAMETKSRREGTKDVADFEIRCVLPESSAAEKWEAEKLGNSSGAAKAG